jgi:hypothetical protein
MTITVFVFILEKNQMKDDEDHFLSRRIAEGCVTD